MSLGVQHINGASSGSSGGSSGGGSGANQVVTSTEETASGTVAAGATSVLFECSSHFVGTINGIARPAGFIRSYTSKEAYTLPEIEYTITSGTITIETIV